VAGLRTHGLPLNAFTLHADHEEHERRIDNDTIEVEAAGWRRRRRADDDAALGCRRTSSIFDLVGPVVLGDRHPGWRWCAVVARGRCR
jgi:hypothetical protein